MSTKKGRRRVKGDSVKDTLKSTDRKSEILVLTPDILKKLGIDAKDLSQYLEIPKNHSINNYNLDFATEIEELQQSKLTISKEAFNMPIISSNSTESSMLETASLMTKSVFLSPTFATNSITDNEMVKENYYNNELINSTEAQIYNVNINNKSSKHTLQNRDLVDYVVDANIDIDYNDLECNVLLANTCMDNTIKSDVGYLGNKIPANDISSNSLHLNLEDDESFVDEILTATVEDGNITIELTDTHNNSIIKESIKADLKEMKQIANVKCHTNGILRNHIMSKVSETNNIIDNSFLKDHDMVEPNNAVPVERDINFNGANNIVEKVTTGCEKISIQDNSINNNIYSNKYNLTGADNNVKNKETDTASVEVAKSNESVDKVYDQMNNRQILNTAHDFVLGKLNKHGVEKPGGSSRKKDFDFGENLRTYVNCKKKKAVVNKNIINTEMKNSVNEHLRAIDLEEGEEEGNMKSSLKREQFCNCYDFGNKYVYKELSSIYSHIHLQNNKPVCSVRELFDSEMDSRDLKDTQFIEDENDSADFDICWKSLEHHQQQLKSKEQNRDGFVSEKLSVNEMEKTTDEKDIGDNDKQLNSSNEEDIEQKKEVKRRRINSNNSASSDDYPLTKVQINKNQVQKCLKSKNEDTEVKDSVRGKKSVGADNIVCGVCHENVENWEEHIMNKHKYIAWKQGDKSIDERDEDEVWRVLKFFSKLFGGLKCYKCCAVRKYAKAYIQHMKECRIDDENMEIEITKTPTTEKVILTSKNKSINKSLPKVTCGVCSEKVSTSEWLEHIKDKHEYLAWKAGEKPINLEDENEVHQHLYNLCKKYDGLACCKCGVVRKYMKSYLVHVENCKLDKKQEALDSIEYAEDGSPEEILMCGACKKEVKSANWFNHIHREHNYLGWRLGKEELDVNNEESVISHLQKVQLKIPTFECRACGLKRKRIDTFIKHMRICYASQSTLEMNDSVTDDVSNLDVVTCALCEETVKGKKWLDHSVKQHYNLAWIKGGKPIDLKNPYEVDKYLKVYKSKIPNNKLICKHCQESRMSHLGFYAHIVVCNKTEEEIEAQKETCETCQMRFLSIHRQHHMRVHEMQSMKEEIKEDPLPNRRTNGYSAVGSRKAAAKALAVINKYKRLNDDLFSCLTCNFVADDEKEFKNHDCAQVNTSDSSYGSAVTSSDEDIGEWDDDDDDDDDNRVSGNSHTINSLIPLPFKINNANIYIKESFKDLCQMNFSQENLYPEWKHSQYEILEEGQHSSYLPTLNESCQLSLHKGEWSIQNMFEATYKRELYSIFLGGYPTRIAWAPPRSYQIPSADNEYIAVACHRELPSEVYDELSNGPNLIQIWNMHKFYGEIPKLSMCIAHDYGVIWSMAWCPSGAREFEGDDENRLGLLAISCSNGHVYLLPVPNPNKFSEKTICRIKPMAELRLCSSTERKMYQATCVEWSKKSGHSVIIVGYASGVIAYFDLSVKSPMLKREEGGVAIFYPYHDEQMFKGPVLSVGLYAGKTGCAYDVVGGTSLCGAALMTRAGAAPLTRHEDLMCTAGGFMYTHWPAFILTCDDPNASQRLHELEAFGEHRRMPTSNCADCCMHCGEVASIALPQIRVLRPPHPVNTDIKKQLRALIDMIPLKEVPKKRKADDLAVKIEPYTYEETIKKYGLQIHFTRKDKGVRLAEPSADRFLLSHVKDTAFCLSPQFHTQAAFVTQSGMLFVMPLEYGN